MTIPASVSAPNVARADTAGYRHRAVAALLDGLVLYAMLLVIFTSWLVIAQPRAAVQEAPPLVNALSVVVVGLYVLATTAFGRTLGMRAIGLRIVRSHDGAGLGPLRVVSRSLVLLLATGLLLSPWALTSKGFGAHPYLLVVYSLWMLLNTKHQMLHDQIAGTVVIRTASSSASRKGSAASDPSLGSLEPPQAQALWEELDQVRRRARGDLHAASVPLFVLGLIAAGGALADMRDPMSFFSLYWAFAGPVGLAVTAFWFRQLQRRQGAGTGVGQLVMITIFVTCGAVVSWVFPIGGVITAVGFFALAFTQRSRVLAAAAILFGVVTGAEQPLHFISNGVLNRIPNAAAGVFGYHGSAVVFAVLALLFFGAGVSALRRERLG
jgi:uncharacterized RDD family membrane protein YckC